MATTNLFPTASTPHTFPNSIWEKITRELMKKETSEAILMKKEMCKTFFTTGYAQNNNFCPANTLTQF